MRKFTLLSIFLSCLFAMNAQDSSRFSIPLNTWNLKILGHSNFHPTYLADPLGARFEVNAQSILYSDFDMSDEVNEGGDYLGKLVIIPGVRFSLFKFSPNNNPNIGIEFDLGFTTPIFMRAGNHDVIGMDGIYYFAIAAKPTDWLSFRFSKHHICTHIGDEYATGTTKSVIDFDPNITQLPVRDDFIFSAAAKPLHFLKNKSWDIFRIYADIGFFWPGVDFLGTRQNKPNKHAWMNLQGGIEAEYYFKNKYLGGLYSGYNVSAYQANAFSPNISFVAGYIIPQERFKKKLRMGVHYYNGRSLSNQFYNRKERFISFALTMDI